MARQINTKIVGTFESVIYYKSGEEYLMRSKGNTGVQAAVAKQQAGILGKASGISAKLRTAFKNILPANTDRKLMYRLNNVLQQWLRTNPANETIQVNSIPVLQGFSFNSNNRENDFYVAMPVTRNANGQISLQLPAFDSPNPIYPLPFNGTINLEVIAASCNIADPADIRSYETKLDINYTGDPIPAQQLLLELETKPGFLTVIALSINKTATGIVWAMYN